MQLANQEAQRFNQKCIGSEHMLLGLVKDESGFASRVLKKFDIDSQRIRREVVSILPKSPDTVSHRKLPRTPQAKKAIEYSFEEARNLNCPDHHASGEGEAAGEGEREAA